jgi:transcriptional regulator with XRE-family HTH domain
MAEENNGFLRERRMAMHLTQQAVADRAGICLQQYQKLEYGERDLNNASFCLAVRILEALQINVSDYLRGDYTEVTKSPREELTGMDTGNVKYYLLHFEVEESYMSSVNKVLQAANLTFEEAFKAAVEYYGEHPDELKEAAEKCKGEPEIVTNACFIPVHEGETEAAAIEAAMKIDQ